MPETEVTKTDYDPAWIAAPATRLELWEAVMHISMGLLSTQSAVLAARFGDEGDVRKAIESLVQHENDLRKFATTLLKPETGAADVER